MRTATRRGIGCATDESAVRGEVRGCDATALATQRGATGEGTRRNAAGRDGLRRPPREVRGKATGRDAARHRVRDGCERAVRGEVRQVRGCDATALATQRGAGARRNAAGRDGSRGPPREVHSKATDALGLMEYLAGAASIRISSPPPTHPKYRRKVKDILEGGQANDASVADRSNEHGLVPTTVAIITRALGGALEAARRSLADAKRRPHHLERLAEHAPDRARRRGDEQPAHLAPERLREPAPHVGTELRAPVLEPRLVLELLRNLLMRRQQLQDLLEEVRHESSGEVHEGRAEKGCGTVGCDWRCASTALW